MPLATVINTDCLLGISYGYTLQEIDNTDYEPHHFFTARWGSLLEKQMGTADWILAHDIDTINTNFTKPLTMLTDQAADADVILQVRSNTEVIAGFVLMRGDSLYSACFLVRISLCFTLNPCILFVTSCRTIG